MKQLKKIKAGGKLRPIKFGFNALARFGDLSGLKLNEILEMDGEKLSLSDMINIVFCAFEAGAITENETVDFSTIDVGNWLDDDPEIFTEAMDVFVESMPKLSNTDKSKNVKRPRLKLFRSTGLKK